MEEFIDRHPQLANIVAWIERHDVTLWWLAAFSAVTAVVMLAMTPWLVSLIPDDYFATKERPPIVGRSRHPVLRWCLRIGKNVLGLTLIVFGLLLSLPLVPGQGMIMALGGLLLLEFPGKRRLEMWVVRRPGLLRAINWFRAHRSRPPLVIWSPQADEEELPTAPPEREVVRR